MADVHDRETRSRNMAAIRNKDTKPEILFRKALFARGFRYRLHVKALPGKPDLALRKYRVAVFVHGCFWHHHDCHLFKWPKSNPDFWREKISRNATLDTAHQKKLKGLGWRVAVVWQCAMPGKSRKYTDTVLDEFERWLESGRQSVEIAGILANA